MSSQAHARVDKKVLEIVSLKHITAKFRENRLLELKMDLFQAKEVKFNSFRLIYWHVKNNLKNVCNFHLLCECSSSSAHFLDNYFYISAIRSVKSLRYFKEQPRITQHFGIISSWV